MLKVSGTDKKPVSFTSKLRRKFTYKSKFKFPIEKNRNCILWHRFKVGKKTNLVTLSFTGITSQYHKEDLNVCSFLSFCTVWLHLLCHHWEQNKVSRFQLSGLGSTRKKSTVSCQPFTHSHNFNSVFFFLIYQNHTTSAVFSFS